MVWSNWQGAIWRGAMLVLLFWSGLAWTQTPAPRPTADPADRIMVVHENGKSTRCRVMETWQLPDGRVAHLLQGIETGELITIVDEQGSRPEATGNSAALPKRIFAWGLGRRTPPEGSPIPPQLRIDSGVVIKNEIPVPTDAIPTPGPVVVNRVVEEQALGASYTIRNDVPITIVEKGPAVKPRPAPFRFVPKREVGVGQAADPQVVAFGPAPQIVQGTPPMIVNEAPNPPVANTPAPFRFVPKREVVEARPADPQVVTFGNTPQIVPITTPTIRNEAPNPPVTYPPPAVGVAGGRETGGTQNGPPPRTERITPNMKLMPTSTSNVYANAGTTFSPSNKCVPTCTGVCKNCDPNNTEMCQPAARKHWYPGVYLQAWLQGKATPRLPTTEAVKVEVVKADDTTKLQKAQDFLAPQNKVADKQFTEKIEKMYGTPFSTARMAVTNAPQPEMKKPEPSPLAIANNPAKDDKPIIPAPAPKDETVKTTNPPSAPKRDMWGNEPLTPVLPPGKSMLDPATLRSDLVKLPAAPTARPNDPLLTPEKLVPNDDRLKPKAALPAPAARDATETGMLPNPSDLKSSPYPARPAQWPLGTQSVQAANSGLIGTPMYIPVPTVTVPQPNNPPVPPAPKLPEAPNPTAYVNAFTPPPPPKGAPQQQPMQGMMPPQAMASYGYPMMTPQQMMMQQQMMAQQQMLAQQQMMMQYGYRPNPAMLYPYMPQQPMMTQGMPSQGPLANFSRQYMGPQAPNPFAANPGVQTGYAPAPYSPMTPAQPQQSGVQPVAYQQQPMPTQQPANTQQVEQLIKVMRESPYPAQREFAAQSLASFEWRAHPQIVPALIQSASQDPAASVRAGCVYCLGRMQAAVEPVFGTLQAMRNDIDPRVRAEVEQAFTRLGQTPMRPQ